MQWKRWGRIVGLVLVVAAGSACSDSPAPAGSTGSAQLAGVYECAPPNEEGPPDRVELVGDGTLIITQPARGSESGGEHRGTWSAEGTTGFFNPGSPAAEKFIAGSGRLEFSDGFVCVKK